MWENTKLCPCNSGEAYSFCCESLILGKKVAPIAEALMRSRYTAYVLKDEEYLLKTWHSSTKPLVINTTLISRWCGLHIIRTEAGSMEDNHGIVEFKAIAIKHKNVLSLHEISRFVKENNKWFYVDGDVMKLPSNISGKVGPNIPCPCGSGKKFKKCCYRL